MGTPATSNSTTSIPDEYKKYFSDMLNRAQTESLTPYTPYGGQRLAGSNADIMGSHEMVRDMATQGMPGTAEAMDMTRNASSGIGAFANADPYQYSQFGYSGPGEFDAASANKYMNPFVQNVLGQQNEQAARDYQIQNAGRNAKAVQAGAFGGSRQAVQQGMAENDLLNRQNMTQATGLRDAYSDAQKMFETDRQARMTNERDRAAELTRVQAGQAGENYNRDTLGLKGLEMQGTMANQLSTLEQRARAGDIEAARMLEAAGKQEQAQTQAGLDIDYNNFTNQRDYNQNQVNNFSNILQGLPLAGAGQVSGTSTPAQGSLLQQGVGLGLTALGAYNSIFGP
jgi:hypothetical protein